MFKAPFIALILAVSHCEFAFAQSTAPVPAQQPEDLANVFGESMAAFTGGNHAAMIAGFEKILSLAWKKGGQFDKAAPPLESLVGERIGSNPAAG